MMFVQELNTSACPASGLPKNSCFLLTSDAGEKDALAAVRMMVSLLSIIGTSAIIASIISKRLIWRPTIHPILQLSIADWVLGVLWVVGAYIWFRGVSNMLWCFAVSFTTVVLECVTANLTLVYAFLAYSFLKKKSNRSGHDAVYSNSFQVWHPVKSVLVYLTAWILPLILVTGIFASLAETAHLVKDANICSCWCFPHIGNILPHSLGKDEPSARYLWHIRKLLVAYSALLFLNFLTVLVIMSLLYWKIIKEIKKIKKRIATLGDEVVNRAMRSSQSMARKKIMHFMSVFLVVTFSMVIFCILVLYYEGSVLQDKDTPHPLATAEPAHYFYDFVHLFQSMTVPLQGFLNAIVYGSTREDFVHMMGNTARFFSEEENGAKVHVIHYNSTYDEDDESNREANLTRSKREKHTQSLSDDCPTPLLNSTTY